MIPKPKSIFKRNKSIKYYISFSFLHLKSDELVPSDAFLQQLPVGINHVDDHSNDVTDEDEDHEELARPGLARHGALRPVLQLLGEGGRLKHPG